MLIYKDRQTFKPKKLKQNIKIWLVLNRKNIDNFHTTSHIQNHVNWSKLDKCWKEYAEKNKAELKYNEQNLFHAIKCEYEFTNVTDFWKTKFIGILWKSQEGHNKDRTNILTKFIDKKSKQTLNINNSKFRNLFARNKFKGIEKDIYQKFKNIGGKKLKLDNHNLEIELYKIISEQSEFEQVTELLTLIKNYR